MAAPAATKTDLLLLGLLLDRPMHGYELYQQIQAEGIDGWFHISAAGIYYSLRKLRDQGSVAESRQTKGGSSRKSIYRLTDKGRNAFFQEMDVELASQEEIYLDYDLAIYLLNRLPSKRVIPQLEKRMESLAEQSRHVQEAMSKQGDNGNSPLTLAILDHKRRYLKTEQDWLAEVISSIRAESEAPYTEDRQQRGLMSLSGDLADFHLPDLFRLIVTGQHNGTLTVTDGAEIWTLSFEGGQPAYASYLKRGEPTPPLTSCSNVLEGLCELFHWQEGRFVFEQRTVHQDWHVPVDCSAEEMMLRGCRKVDTWDIIQRLVPSADTIFEPGSAILKLDQLEMTPLELQVVAAVDGIKNVATIARELDQTLFETSRAFYCLAAIGVLRTADLDRISLRRVFREMAELMCHRTHAWRDSPDDRSCEEQVNENCQHLPLSLENGRIRDATDPQLGVDDLRKTYYSFLQQQYKVIGSRFGRTNARQSYQQTLEQLAPELQDVARRYGFHQIEKN